MLLREEYVSRKVGYPKYCSEVYNLGRNDVANASTVLRKYCAFLPIWARA